MAKLKAPENSGGMTHDGVEYAVVRGFITVPDDRQDTILAAISHGFMTTGKSDAESDPGDEVAVAAAAIAAQAEAQAAEAAAIANQLAAIQAGTDEAATKAAA